MAFKAAWPHCMVSSTVIGAFRRKGAIGRAARTRIAIHSANMAPAKEIPQFRDLPGLQFSVKSRFQVDGRERA